MTPHTAAARLALIDAIAMSDDENMTMSDPLAKGMLSAMKLAAGLAGDNNTGDVLRALIRLTVRHAEAVVDPSEHRLMLMEDSLEEMRAAVDTLLENEGSDLSGYWSNIA